MSSPFSRTLGQPVPQTEQAREDQVINSAGGFVFQVSDKTRLERFLILGTDGGTYYADEKKLTKENVKFLEDVIKRDEQLVIDVVHDISTNGRAFRNSAAIFAVAALFTHGKQKPDSLLSDVCRTGTHLFEFAEYIELLGGWGRSKRDAVANWYTSKDRDKLAYQAVKYRQRNGWTHKDMLRLSHPVGLDKNVGNFILGKDVNYSLPVDHIIIGFKNAQAVPNIQELVQVLNGFPSLPWEAVPTVFHKNIELWKTLFYNGALTGQALLRNITRLARLGGFSDMVFARDYANKLTDREMIKKTKLHPIQYLLALNVHTEGQTDRKAIWSDKKKDWTESAVIVDALNAGFYAAFDYLEPAGKRTLIGLDVSGSMSSNALGLDLSCAKIGAAVSMAIARSEPYYQVMGFANTFRDLGISPSMSLHDVLRVTESQNFGSTDCALPMFHALDNNIEVDTFVVITDNETWAGRRGHPFQALKDYRKRMGIDAKLVVAGLTATNFSIADPTDRGMVDVVGADANLPKLITEFSAGRI